MKNDYYTLSSFSKTIRLLNIFGSRSLRAGKNVSESFDSLVEDSFDGEFITVRPSKNARTCTVINSV